MTAAGGRPPTQTDLAVTHLAFSGRSLGGEPELLRALLRVKKAAALANAEAGDVPRDIAMAVVRACDGLLQDAPAGLFPVDVFSGGGGLALNVNVNEVIADRASADGRSVDPKRHVNASQSSADVCHTAFRVAILTRWEAVDPVLAGLVASLQGKALAFADVRMLTRTCLRDALPGRLGDLFGGHAALVARRREAVAQNVAVLGAVNLGGTVVGSGEGASAGYRDRVIDALARVTGFPLRRRESLFDAAQNGDDLGAVSGALAQLAVGLLKLAQDVRLLSSGPETGFGELALPAVMEGSSFFRGKVNPLVPESLMHCCFLVLGADRAAQESCAHAELQLNGFETVAAISVLDALAMLGAAVERFDVSCLRGLEADVARCRAHVAHAHPR